jgi:hypothetical protein
VLGEGARAGADHLIAGIGSPQNGSITDGAYFGTSERFWMNL